MFIWNRTTQSYSNRSRAIKPKDIKGSRLYIKAKSVGEVKRLLKNTSGITKIRSCTKDGYIEVIHTLNKLNLYKFLRFLDKKDKIWSIY